MLRRVPVSSKPIDDDDVDVACERQRVLRGDADNDMLKIKNLTKVNMYFANFYTTAYFKLFVQLCHYFKMILLC